MMPSENQLCEPALSGESNTFARGVVPGLISQTASLLSSFLSAVLIARLAGATQLGTYAVALATTGLITMVTGLQLTTQAARARSTAEAIGYLHWAVRAGFAGALVTMVVAFAAKAAAMPAPEVIAFLAPSVFAEPFIQSAKGLIAHQARGWALFNVQALRAVGRPAGAIAAWCVVPHVTAAALAVVDSSVAIACLVVAYWMIAPTLRRHTGDIERTAFRALVRSFGPLLAASVSWQLIQRFDLLCVATFVGRGVAGQYQVSLRLFEMLMVAYGGMVTFVVPGLAQASHQAVRQKILRQATVVTTAALLPGVIVLAVFGDVLTRVLFGQQFVLPPAVYGLLSVGVAVQLLTGPSGYMLVVRRQHRQITMAAAAAAATAVVLNLVFVPAFGVTAAATSSSASFAVLNVLYWRAATRDVTHAANSRESGALSTAAISTLTVAALLTIRLAIGTTTSALLVSIAVAAVASVAGLTRPPALDVVRASVRRTPRANPAPPVRVVSTIRSGVSG